MPFKAILNRLRNLDAAALPSAKTSTPFEPFRDYFREARRLGLSKPYLFLSFDCDTDWDAEVVEQLHDFLEVHGICATYAVPGAQLLRNPDPYRRLAARGVEFMNHGAMPHAEWRGKQWAGITFYDSMNPSEIEADIRRGHEIVTQVIGRAPKGFRAPHFGCFQKPNQLGLIYRVAEDLKYDYCSTTLPSLGLLKGPVAADSGKKILEIPCFGSIRHPTTILDSWTYLENRKKYKLSSVYADLVVETVEAFTTHNKPGIFSWYADPCHVFQQHPFIKAIKFLSRKKIDPLMGKNIQNTITL